MCLRKKDQRGFPLPGAGEENRRAHAVEGIKRGGNGLLLFKFALKAWIGGGHSNSLLSFLRYDVNRRHETYVFHFRPDHLKPGPFEQVFVRYNLLIPADVHY